jgi:predicted nuclease of restriction endonuclease-like RecB superfamily
VPVRAGKRLFFPDFTFSRGSQTVHAEIVGYYTREYLARKTAALEAAGMRNLVICVDDALDCGEAAFAAGGRILRYRRRVDARALLSAVESVAAAADSPAVG